MTTLFSDRPLVYGQQARVVFDGQSVLIKPEAALRQIEADRRKEEKEEEQERQLINPVVTPNGVTPSIVHDGRVGYDTNRPVPPKLRRYHGTVELDTMRLGRDAGRIAEEIVQHLSTLPGARIRVRLEIEAELPDGAPEGVVRTVAENGRTLKFLSQGFEEE